MRVWVIVKSSEGGDKAFVADAWSTEMLAAMGRFNDALRAAGILLSAEGLKPTAQGKRVHFEGSDRTVVDGPFPESRDQISGCWLWQVKDMDEAVAWVRRCPNPMPGPSMIEIRPLYEATDLA